jgi:hypothetical protein
MLTPTGIKIDTEDGTFDLANVTWQAVAPCGCISGVTMASFDMIVTAEQAGRQFAQTDAEYKRSVERGFSWRPREHRAACEGMKHDCPHDPKWGYEHPPVPDGYKWAAVSKLGGRSKLTHLVPLIALENARGHNYSAGSTKSLCGRADEFHWKDEWYAKDGKIECAACWKLGVAA